MTDTFSSQPMQDAQPVAAGFIYENEHPQLQIPFAALVGGRRLEGKSLSITEAFVSGLLPINGRLERNTMTLQFNFEGFNISLPVVADIDKIGHEDSPDYRLRFCDPAAGHLAPLRHILNSHLAGDLVTMDRFLGYAGPTQAKKRSAVVAPTKMQRAGRLVRQVGILALSIGLIAVAANIVHDRFVFNYEPRPVVISQSGETLRATSAGQITYTNEAAAAGDVVYSIAANSGDLLSVRMPCDCDVQPLSDFYEGATILAGTPLVKLTGQDDTLEVSTLISYEGAARLMAGDAAELELADGRVVPAKITLPETADSSQGTNLVAAQISFPDVAADSSLIGENARLRFRRNLLPDWLTNSFSSAATEAQSLSAES